MCGRSAGKDSANVGAGMSRAGSKEGAALGPLFTVRVESADGISGDRHKLRAQKADRRLIRGSQQSS